MDQKKRECIIVAALKAFSRLGFKKASVDDIAKDAGVAKGTVYLAAESKEDLLYQALLHDLRVWNAELSKLIDPRADPIEMLGVLATAGLTSLSQRPLLKQLFEGELHALLPGWQDHFDELTHLGRKNVIEVLEIGKKQGRFRPDLDAPETAVLLMDLQVSTMLFHNRESPDREARLARRMNAAMGLLLHGLLTSEAPPPRPSRPAHARPRS
jgi:AcrR family transcriptional regulator